MEPPVRERLERLGRIVLSEKARMPDAMVEANLADAALIIGQTALPRERLDRAKNLKAVVNVETNLLPNIDYQACQERGIWVLTPASAVAESALAMAIDLARGITAADRAFRNGTERYGLDGNADTFRFANAPVGIIGLGDLGRNLRELIRPFRNPVKVYDPWLPDDLITKHDCKPASLDELLAASRVIFMFVSVTSENEAMIGRREFGLMTQGTAFLLMSRAAVVDFPAMLEAVNSGHIRAATDRLSQGASCRRRSGAPRGRTPPLGSSHGRHSGLPFRDRTHDRSGRRTCDARPAAADVSPRRSVGRGPNALKARVGHLKRWSLATGPMRLWI